MTDDEKLAQAEEAVETLTGFLQESMRLLTKAEKIMLMLVESRNAAQDVILVAYNELEMGTRENAIKILSDYMEKTKS